MLRVVPPSYHTLHVSTKGRWFGHYLLDVLSKEFRSRDRVHYQNQIKFGTISVSRNGEILTDESVLNSLKLQNKDIVNITIHKHEPPVLSIPSDGIKLLFEDDHLLVVSKPCSLPVHPTGRYYKNSLTEVLKEQFNGLSFFPCHRLDRLTSGVLILAKSNEMASIIQKQIREKTVRKEYLARVSGKFPSSSKFYHADYINKGIRDGSGENEIIVDNPVGVIDTKLGFIKGVRPKREAITEFKLIRYNEELDQSIVLCSPLTGRTHQIRIHLNWLGFPIVNDPLYGPTMSPLRKELIHLQMINQEQFTQLLEEDLERLEKYKALAPVCEECGELLMGGTDEKEMVMWLHSLKFKIDENMIFETEEPEWANI